MLGAGVAGLAAWFNDRDRILPRPLVNGRELVEAVGREPGPWIRDTLDAVEAAQASGDIRQHDQALAFAIKVALDI
jgi:hypothetical protein